VLRSAWVALGAGSVLSSQEVTRVAALVWRGSIYSLCRRVDWFDGEEPKSQVGYSNWEHLPFQLECSHNLGCVSTAIKWP
jgi:hypothetical protein